MRMIMMTMVMMIPNMVILMSKKSKEMMSRTLREGRVPRSCLVGGNQTIIVCAPTICQNIKLQLFSSPFYTTSRLYLLFPSLPFRYLSVFCYVVEMA